MKLAADALVALVALLHVWFLVLEMFLWDKPLGLKTFRHSAAEAAASKVLAANQGLYNGFLAAGLAWGLSLGAAGTSVKVFFLGCVVVALVALLHVWFLVLEMFLWDKPTGLRTFGHSAEHAAASKVLAANQGLYNGFLAAGLVWGLTLGSAGTAVKVFFLACVIVAGVYGAATASRKILFVQALPAALALVLVLAAR